MLNVTLPTKYLPIELNGIAVELKNSTFAKGANIEGGLNGRAKPTSEMHVEVGARTLPDFSGWCNCDDNAENQFYFHDKITGSHGYACRICRKIRQTG